MRKIMHFFKTFTKTASSAPLSTSTPIDPMELSPKQLKQWLLPRLKQLPGEPLINDSFDYTEAELNMLRDLKLVFDQPDQTHMQEALQVVRTIPETKNYVDYLQSILDQMTWFKNNYRAVGNLNRELLNFKWPDQVKDGVKTLHDDVLPNLALMITKQLTPDLQPKFQANYAKLMEDYDIKAWTRLSLNVYHTDSESDRQQAICDYMRVSRDHMAVLTDDLLQQAGLNKTMSANLINPLMIQLQQQLVGNLFLLPDDIDAIDTKIQTATTPKAVLNWLLLSSWSHLLKSDVDTWDHMTHPQLTWRSDAYLFDDRNLVASITKPRSELVPMQYGGYDVSNWNLSADKITKSVPVINELQSAYYRLQQLNPALNLFAHWPRFVKKATLIDELEHHQTHQLNLVADAPWNENIDDDVLDHRDASWDDYLTDKYTPYLQISDRSISLMPYYRRNDVLDVIITVPKCELNKYLAWLWNVVQNFEDAD